MTLVVTTGDTDFTSGSLSGFDSASPKPSLRVEFRICVPLDEPELDH